MITVEDIFKAKELYCENCCLSCDECGLKDFFDFELWDLIERVKENENYSR